jgi:hypothetical protein
MKLVLTSILFFVLDGYANTYILNNNSYRTYRCLLLELYTVAESEGRLQGQT